MTLKNDWVDGEHVAAAPMNLVATQVNTNTDDIASNTAALVTQAGEIAALPATATGRAIALSIALG